MTMYEDSILDRIVSISALAVGALVTFTAFLMFV